MVEQRAAQRCRAPGLAGLRAEVQRLVELTGAHVLKQRAQQRLFVVHVLDIQNTWPAHRRVRIELVHEPLIPPAAAGRQLRTVGTQRVFRERKVPLAHLYGVHDGQ